MSVQFNVNQSAMGDITVQGGVIVDMTQSPTASILIGHDVGEAVQSDPNTNSYAPAPVPSGGSGRNIIIQKTPYAGLPDGVFFPRDNTSWYSSNYGSGFRIRYSVEFSGGVAIDQRFRILDNNDNIIATSNFGSIESKSTIVCSSAYASGGATPTSGLSKWIYLGSSTGNVDFTYASTTGNCSFVVNFNGSNVISVSGSGSASFNKTSSVKFARVIVTSLTESSAWNYNLGCPGAISPPVVFPTGRTIFNASLTAYGLTLTGGVNVPLVCTYEGDPNFKTCSVTSEDIVGIFGMRSDDFQRFYNNSDNKLSIVVDPFPFQYRLIDFEGDIAIRSLSTIPSTDSTDPSGSYESTTYGANKYNAGVPFNVYVQLDQNPSLTLVHYYVLNLTGGGSISSYEGPISAPTLPANTATKKHIPVASFDATANTLLQLWEGPILWR